jgi:hypothetical protein
MSTVTAHAPLPILTAGQRFTLQSATVIGSLFIVAFCYGLAERNMIADVATVVVFAWQVVTNPWLYCAGAAGVIVWKNRRILTEQPRPAVVRQQHRQVAEPAGGRHRAARRG